MCFLFTYVFKLQWNLYNLLSFIISFTVQLIVMASRYLQKFPIPAGFQEILSDFTRQVLRDQPTNIIEYAAQYFESLEKGKKFEFDSNYNVKKDDKKYELNYNPKNAEQITKKAGSITQKLNQASGNVSAERSRNVSEHSTQPIGTEKTVTGQQTQNYMNNLSQTIAENTQQNNPNSQQKISTQEDLMSQAINSTVNLVFSQFDRDNDGFLSGGEIVDFVQSVIKDIDSSIEVTQSEIQQFMKEVDKDWDQKISKEELSKFVKKIVNVGKA